MFFFVLKNCDSLNLVQLTNAPTGPNLKAQTKSTLLDLIFTNTYHKYTTTGIFCNNVSDHCTIACVRKKIPKVQPSLIFKRYFKSFEVQAFLHHLSHSDLSRVSLIPDVELEWEYFHTIFLSISNKHVPMKKLRISRRDNPCSQTVFQS